MVYGLFVTAPKLPAITDLYIYSLDEIEDKEYGASDEGAELLYVATFIRERSGRTTIGVNPGKVDVTVPIMFIAPTGTPPIAMHIVTASNVSQAKQLAIEAFKQFIEFQPEVR